MRNTLISFLVLIFAFFLPLYLLHSYKNDILKLEDIQIPANIVLFAGSILLFLLNKKRLDNNPILGSAFKTIGILGFIYSGIVLALLFAFRNGIGF